MQISAIKPTLVFLAGTSAVGKSTLLEHLSTTANVREVKMTARDPRAELGNPSWDDLGKDVRLVEKHQKKVFTHFTDVILREAYREHTHSNPIIVFERSLFDVLGYTEAFNESLGYYRNITMLKEDQFTFADMLMQFLQDILKYRVIIAEVEIDRDIPYVQTDFRPPNAVREACANTVWECGESVNEDGSYLWTSLSGHDMDKHAEAIKHIVETYDHD